MNNKDQSSPAFSIPKEFRGSQVRKDRDLANVGPFSYNKNFVDKKKDPSFSMGCKLESSLVRKGVVSADPTAYNPDITLSKFKAPAYRVGTSSRGATYDARKAKLVPAPGTYEIKSQCFETARPRFFIGQKLTFDDTTKFIHSLPGPGTFDASPTAIKQKSPQYSMGARIASLKNSTAIVPGPGQYLNNSQKFKTAAPSFGFGTSKRPDIGGKKNMQVPGPGAYKVPVKLADTAPYALPNRKPESKYV